MMVYEYRWLHQQVHNHDQHHQYPTINHQNQTTNHCYHADTKYY
jgi:hypothetical protein